MRSGGPLSWRICQCLMIARSLQRGDAWSSYSCRFRANSVFMMCRRSSATGTRLGATTRTPQSPSIESELSSKRGFQYVIGSDEAGRGCIAGPVVVASCCCLKVCNEDDSYHNVIQDVDDSKNLSERHLNTIYEQVVSRPDLFAWNVAFVEANVIDQSNILRATLDGFADSIESLVQTWELHHNSTYSIVDGKKSPKLSIPVSCRPWVRADSQVYSVALASVLARVTRDRAMTQYHNKYPVYGFHEHKGYPTRSHVQAIHTHGPCKLHRMSCKPLRGRSLWSRRSMLTTAAALGAASTAVHLSQPTFAMSVDPRSGIALPDVGEIEAAIPVNWTDAVDVFQGSPQQFARLDTSPDSLFYEEPRFVEHVDDNAVALMTRYISDVAMQVHDSVLDLCSSWTSHVDPLAASRATRIAGLGMNARELASNPVLTDWTVQDLNKKPTLPYKDESFSVVLCQLSIDYLTRPLETLREVGRVLKPGGTVHILFSNRLFLSKAVALWTGADDIDHAYTVGCYLHCCNGGFENVQARDLSSRQGRAKRIAGDPMYVVTAMKARAPA